jgi:maltose O-acetyltransferase
MSYFNKLKMKLKYLGSYAYQGFRSFFYRFLSDCKVIGFPACSQPALFLGAGAIEFQGKVSIGFYPSPLFFSTYAHIEARGQHSSIVIKNGTFINNNFCAIAEHTSITIGSNCLIGASVEILDSDFHGVEVPDRHCSKPEWAKAVTIEDNVFIGSNVKIMKGVTIGAGAVIANSSVITRDVPALTVVGGNPASLIKKLECSV